MDQNSATKRKKTHICCVPQCKNYQSEGYSFHKFPNDKNLKKQWETALKMGKPASSHMHVCSEHFKKTDYFPGSADKSKKYLKRNTIPTQKLPIRSFEIQEKASKTERCKRAEQRCLLSAAMSASSSLQPPLMKPVHDEADCSTSDDKQIPPKTFMNAATQTYICPIHLIIIDTSTLYAYTGLQSFELLNGTVECLTDIVKESSTNKKQLGLMEHVMLIFVKIKLNLSYRAMGPLFGISRQAVSKYFKLMIKQLALVLASVIPWPDREDIRSNLPVHFKNYQDTRVVLDCAETVVERSSCLKCRILTYSHYKKNHTVKFMLGVAPSGLITSVSKCYGGRASDKLMTLEAHILDKLEYKDALMVDKGFFIQKECLERNLILHQPPFLAKKNQLTREEAMKNAEIARARVHVERVIQRVRQFEMISSKVEWTLLPHFEDSLIIACAITNLSSPVINIDKFM